MKYTVLFLLLLPVIAFGQLEGRYTTDYVMGYESVKFTKDGRFQYSFAACTHGGEGSGIYELIGDRLLLYFQGDAPVLKPAVVIYQKETQSETFTIETTIYDKDGFTIPGATVVVIGSTIGAYTGADGKATIELSKQTYDSTFSLKISYIDFKTVQLEMSSVSDSKVEVWGREEGFMKQYYYGEVFTFIIKNSSGKAIQMSHANRDPLYFETYRKWRIKQKPRPKLRPQIQLRLPVKERSPAKNY